MNIIVQTAVDIPATVDIPEAVRRCCLPAGFPFLVDRRTGMIVEPSLFFLDDTYLANGGFVKNSATAAANDLKDWWQFLDHKKKAWDEIFRDDIVEYRDIMSRTISPITHEPYSSKTIRRRVGTVLDFYKWAAGEGYVDPIDRTRIARVVRPIDSHPLAHLSSGHGQIEASTILPPDRSSPDDNVRPLTSEQYRSIARHLGPLPSEQPGDPRSSRDRLAADLALNTGMRVDEVAQLTKWQLLGLQRPLDDEHFGIVAMRIVKTKGGRPRTVLIPSWLVGELHAYIDGERAQCIAAGKKLRLKKPGQESKSLFVNRLDARHNVGKGTRKAALQEAFRHAVIAAGLTENILKTDPDTGEQYIVKAPGHCFHDLRHTFACVLYLALKHAGDTEPWKTIQARLGHKHLSTTLNIYLRVVDEFEAQVSDKMTDFFRGLRNGY